MGRFVNGDRMTVHEAVHECVFVEEEEPSGRLILPPCLVCGTAAAEAVGLLKDTLRVLYHVVNTYEEWRPEDLGVPNEFTDDAVRIGREHLQTNGWWPDGE